MRRMLLLLVVGLIGCVAGCKHSQSHGVCDCIEDNHCAERAPWLLHGTPTTTETVVVPPTKLPEGKKGL
jgi:hypothetical protein